MSARVVERYSRLNTALIWITGSRRSGTHWINNDVRSADFPDEPHARDAFRVILHLTLARTQ